MKLKISDWTDLIFFPIFLGAFLVGLIVKHYKDKWAEREQGRFRLLLRDNTDPTR